MRHIHLRRKKFRLTCFDGLFLFKWAVQVFLLIVIVCLDRFQMFTDLPIIHFIPEAGNDLMMFLVDVRGGWRISWSRSGKRFSVQLPFPSHKAKKYQKCGGTLVKRRVDAVVPAMELLHVIDGVLFLQVFELTNHLNLSPVHPHLR